MLTLCRELALGVFGIAYRELLGAWSQQKLLKTFLYFYFSKRMVWLKSKVLKGNSLNSKMSFLSFYSLSSKIRIFLCQFLWIFLILSWHNDGRNSPLCVWWGKRKRYPTDMRFFAAVFCRFTTVLQKVQSWLISYLLFIFFIRLFCSWGEGMQLYVRKQPRGERNTRNLVVILFLVVFSFSVLVWSGPGFG